MYKDRGSLCTVVVLGRHSRLLKAPREREERKKGEEAPSPVFRLARSSGGSLPGGECGILLPHCLWLKQRGGGGKW